MHAPVTLRSFTTLGLGLATLALTASVSVLMRFINSARCSDVISPPSISMPSSVPTVIFLPINSFSAVACSGVRRRVFMKSA